MAKLFGGGGMLSKAWHKTENVTKDVWTHGGKEALTTAGIAGAALLTGGAAAGALGIGGLTSASAGIGAALTSGTLMGAAALTTGLAGYSGARSASLRQDEAEAQAAYQREVYAAEDKAQKGLRANLLSLRKNLQKNYTKSTQGGTSGVADNNTATGGVILG